MMDSSDKKDELDEYGVWVKKNPSDMTQESEMSKNNKDFDSDNTETISNNNDNSEELKDLPYNNDLAIPDSDTDDFDLPDFSDIVLEDTPENNTQESIDDTNAESTDTIKELDEKPELDELNNSQETDFELPDFSNTDFETSSENAEQNNETVDNSETNNETDNSDLPAFDIDSINTEDDLQSEEIPLGDFLNDVETEKDNVANTDTNNSTDFSDGEISIDEFLDNNVEETPVENMVDEAPLDINLDFNDDDGEISDNNSALASNSSTENEINSDSFDSIDPSIFDNDSKESSNNAEGKAVDLDNFDDIFNSLSDESSSNEVPTSTDSNADIDVTNEFTEPEIDQNLIDTEEANDIQNHTDLSDNTESVDLSEFGFDTDTPNDTNQEVKSDEKNQDDDNEIKMNVISDDEAIETSTIPDLEDENDSISLETSPDTISNDSINVSNNNSSEASDDFDLDSILNSVEDENGNIGSIENSDFDSSDSSEESIDATPEVAEEPLSETQVSKEIPVTDTPAEEKVEFDRTEELSSENTKSESDSKFDFEDLNLDNIPDTFEEETAIFSEPEQLDSELKPEESTKINNSNTENNSSDEIQNSILMDIAKQLKDMRNEISSLKADVESIRHASNIEKDNTLDSGDTTFNTLDSDDTTLSGDELDEILNTENVNSPTDISQNYNIDEDVNLSADEMNDILNNTDIIQETESSAEDDDKDTTLSGEELDNILNTTDFVPSDSFMPDSMEEEATLSDDEMNNILNTEDIIDTDTTANVSSTLPDDEIDNFINKTEIEPEYDDDEFAENKDFYNDDILVESSKSDLMDVQSSNDEDIEQPVAEDLTTTDINEVENSENDYDSLFTENTNDSDLTDEKLNYLSEDSTEELTEIPVPTISEQDTENNGIPETMVNDILNSEDSIASATDENKDTDSISDNLKQEIKSVLSYMDQLLESLPEEKISEFAQSEQFETYKKLFKELGLA